MLRVSTIALLLCFAALPACSQEEEGQYGLAIPVTAAGMILNTDLNRTDEGLARTTQPALRVVVSPTVRLGPHLFFYSALGLTSASYFDGTSSNYAEGRFSGQLMNSFLAYSAASGKQSWLFEAGWLSSAFGLAPLEYDDFKMPLIRPPALYTATVMLRPDQIPCGSTDLANQRNGQDVAFQCGGSNTESYGLLPATLYGIPGAEVQLSTGPVDARLQITNSSPANPQSLLSNSQHAQWTAGAGFTAKGGVHLGLSAFQGPYLSDSAAVPIPAGKPVAAFDATGAGVDAQWSRGHWKVEGEWQRFQFDLPGFIRSPTLWGAYEQAKLAVSPRIFLASRFTMQRFGSVTDAAGITVSEFQPPRHSVEAVLGYQLNRRQLVKGGLRFSDFASTPVEGVVGWGYSVELELVTSFVALNKAFR